MSEYAMMSEYGKKMMTSLPRFYETSRIMNSITDAQGKELDMLEQALDELLAQFFVSTATWGLDTWERELGIVVNPLKPIEQRRAVIFSRIRGAGTVTIGLVERVAEAYDNGEVSVKLDPANYLVTIKFVSHYGVPPNLADIQMAIKEILPAHLTIAFEFSYLNWDQLESASITWDHLDALNQSWNEFEVWNP